MAARIRIEVEEEISTPKVEQEVGTAQVEKEAGTFKLEQDDGTSKVGQDVGTSQVEQNVDMSQVSVNLSKKPSTNRSKGSNKKKGKSLFTDLQDSKNCVLYQPEELHYSDYDDDKSQGFHSETYINGNAWAFEQKADEIIKKNAGIIGMA